MTSLPTPSSFRPSDAGVSEVLGSVLLTATAVVLLGGFGLVVLSSASQTEEPASGAFDLDAHVGDAHATLRFVSGSSFALDDARFVLLVGDAERLADYALESPATPGRYSPGDALRLNVTGDPLAEGARLRALVVDKETGKPIGSTVTRALGPSTLPAYVTSAPSLDSPSLTPARLVADGRSLANLTVNAGATYGLDLVRRVGVDLTRIGGAADVPLRDDGQGGDAVASDGIYTVQLSAADHDFAAVPSTEAVTLPITVLDILGKRATTPVTLTLETPPQSKVTTGAKWRDLPPSDQVLHVNLTNVTLRDETALASDQIQIRVSDLLDSTVAWTALVTFADPTTCGGSPGVASIELSRDGLAGSVTYTPTPGPCFSLGALTHLNLANVPSSLDASGATGGWTTNVAPEPYLYASAGLSGTNEATVTFLGDSVSPSPAALGVAQADLVWARAATAASVTVAVNGVPGAPLSLTATAGNGSAALSWSPPASDGGSAITGYDIYRGTTSGAATWIAAIGTNTTFTANDLVNGRTYVFNVTARNAIGQGPSGNEASATPATIPEPPATLDATAGTGNVTLAWTAGADGGSPITGYEIWRGTTSGALARFATVGTNTSFVDSNAANGTTYHYHVRATNALGTSNPSVERSASPSSTVEVQCSSMTVTSGSVDSCTSLQFADLVYATFQESGGTPPRLFQAQFSLNVGGLSGAKTLQFNGYRGNAPEDLLVQAWNVTSGAWETKISMPASTTSPTTFNSTVYSAHHFPSGTFTIRLIDPNTLTGTGSDSNFSSWLVDYVRLVTS